MRTRHEAEFTAYVTGRRNDLVRTATMLTAGDRAQAEDLVQAALVKVYLGWARIDAAQGPHAYARRVLVNVFIDEHRRPWRRRERSHAELPDVAAPPADQPLGDVGAALAELAPRMRAAVVLRHLHDLTVAETAAALGCSEGTVKSQTARGLEQLRRGLDNRTHARSTP